MYLKLILASCLLFRLSLGFIHPIEIHGRYFIDTVTKEPFFLKGIDYQPGGSSTVSDSQDPLSDPNICARDIILFQELGINTIRVYSINPELNHDHCMTLLALAGIYLVLDVNSPQVNQHLNRYEPWVTYNEIYLEHVFKVIEQFATYNNTLGFFAGNEIVNDKKSARNSPTYIKKLIGDIKGYMASQEIRYVPVGYSAADDLNYRISLSKYLECSEGSTDDSVDFYGVNTYQWCGEQTFYTSGYDTLVRDYEDYTRPVFFSEYGCNKVTPRTFEEVATIFSDDMIGVFSGGLAYEFSEEPNNYGLVEIDSIGNVKLLADFDAIKNQYASAELPKGRQIADLYQIQGKKLQSSVNEIPECDIQYDNIEITAIIDDTIAENLLKTGVDVERGKYVTLKESDFYTSYNITNTDGNPFKGEKHVKVVNFLNSVSEFEAFKLRQLQNNGNYGKGSSSIMQIIIILSVVQLVSLSL